MQNQADGVKIPISIVYNKKLQKNNIPQNLLLYGYGSYGSTIDPYFNSARLSLLDRGFIFAIWHMCVEVRFMEDSPMKMESYLTKRIHLMTLLTQENFLSHQIIQKI